MASSSASFRCGGGSCDLLNRRLGGDKVRIHPIRCGLNLRRVRSAKKTISAVLTPEFHSGRVSTAPISRCERRRDGGEAVAPAELDEWMKDSVVEIVKNLREAPLMVHVYGGGSVVEKAVDWAEAKERWEAGVSPLPERLIFVEELSDRDKEDENDAKQERNDNYDGETRAFGLVVQGRGPECFPVCYLLKTSTAGFGSRSGSGCGFGVGCTHFCLVRVNGFRETTESQLKNCWLLQAQARFRPKARDQ